MLKTFIKPILNILIFSVVLIAVRVYLHEKELNHVKQIFIEEQTIAANEVATTLKEKMKLSYETLRTISLLPGVRSYESSSQKLSEDSVSAIQQMYNNIYNNIKLSEIYLLHKNFNYKNIDPVTQKNEEPLMVFDELISDNQKKVVINDPLEKTKLPEVEDYEYEIHKKQLDFFKKNYPNNKEFSKTFQVPLLSSQEAITCDNSEFTKYDLDNKNDDPRKGIVLTVPKYNIDGNFSGAISAVLRTNVIKSYMPEAYYGLVNLDTKTQIIKKPSKDWLDSLKYFEKNQLNPKLIYSKIIPIKTMDSGKWFLWVAIPDSEFFKTEGYENAMNHYYIEIIVALGIILSLILLEKKVLQNNILLIKSNSNLNNQKIQLERDNLLLKVLSHDVSNTLSVIKGGIQVLKKLEDKESDEALKIQRLDLNERMKIATDVAVGVLDHVRELKAIESGLVQMKMQPTNINEVFKTAEIIFDKQLKDKNITLTLKNYSNDSLFICHKSSFVNSVFNNLISNAIKFSPANSEIIVRTVASEEDYKIFIQDFGPGIPEKIAKNLFTSEKSASTVGTAGEKGTGFGLTLAKTYIEHYKGTLSFTTNTTGETGTTFKISLKIVKV